VLLTVRLPRSLRLRVRVRCVEQGLSVQAFVQQAAHEYLIQHARRTPALAASSAHATRRVAVTRRRPISAGSSVAASIPRRRWAPAVVAGSTARCAPVAVEGSL